MLQGWFHMHCHAYISLCNRVGKSREIYSNSVPLSPPHWPYPKRIRPPSWPRVAVASSTQNTKLFTWRTWPGAGAVPKYDWAARCQCGSKQRRADHTKYIWYVGTHGQSVITTELMIAWIWKRGWLCTISSVIVWKMTTLLSHTCNPANGHALKFQKKCSIKTTLV